jgi:tetratricopeptide (TPR) repeat protein
MDKRPLSMSRQDLEKLVESDLAQYPRGGDADSQSQDQFWRTVGVTIQRKDDASNAEVKSVTGEKPSFETMLSANPLKVPDVRYKQQVNNNESQMSQAEKSLLPRSDNIYEQMKLRLGRTIELPQDAPAAKQAEANESTVSKTVVTQEEFDKAYKSFAARSEDKFNQHIRAAEGFMKEGRFYRAADAYTLASIYKPNDPLGYAGKSIALFGTGEYLSSSLFLARALEMFPEYAKVRIDLVGMIGDKDTVENRILEARDWASKSGSGELDFLLSYIFYQMDRMEFARQSIEAATKMMPDSPAVAAMKKAVDERLAKP